MTARTFRLEDFPICNVNGCRMPAAFQMTFRFADHPAGTPEQPLEIAVGIFVCEHHAEHPIQTPREFFTPEGRDYITKSLAVVGQPQPDFDGAAYHFKPLPALERKGAH